MHPAGVLTLGLQSDQTRQEDGIHWSLLLAHLRYYGDPVVTSRSVSKNGSKLTLTEFLQVSLGPVFKSWGEQGKDIEKCARYLKALKDCAKFDPAKPHQMPEDNWLEVLCTAAEDFLNLSFAGASMLLDIGFTRSCDKEIYILETLVSVHEGGQWVADLDVLGSWMQNPCYTASYP